jgi:hypothetical protein
MVMHYESNAKGWTITTNAKGWTIESNAKGW